MIDQIMTSTQAMMRRVAGLGILVLPILLASCAQPAPYSALDEAFMRDAERKPWNKIAILPFTGDPSFRRVAAEWFAFQVRGEKLFEIVGPVGAEIELKEKGIAVGEEEIPVEKACAAGRELGSDAVIVGSVKREQHPRGLGRLPAAGLSIVEASTCKVLATSIQYPVRRSYDMQEDSVSAVERVVRDVLPLLNAAAGRPWTLPEKKAAKKEPSAERTEEKEETGAGFMPW